MLLLPEFLASEVENVNSGTEKRLFNNLPAAYHDALNAAIAHVGIKP